ncbi:hypothetical protein ACFYY5_29090 [Nocardia elegans]|uniref:Uncharacterized protein n=1 Tax=Nocardia elegans TaxID=300029 RepID=A0ABW6TL97_9NOCA
MTDRDIIDAIDELVDAQMRQTRSGYDYNINQDQCPHAWCSEPWHGLAITKRMHGMRRKWQAAVNYYEDEDGVTDDIAAELDAYRYDQDDSEILCPGSLFTGEFVPPEPEYPRYRVARSTWTVATGEPYSPPVEVQFPRPWILNPTIRLFNSNGEEVGTIDPSWVQSVTTARIVPADPIIDMDTVFRLESIRLVVPVPWERWTGPGPLLEELHQAFVAEAMQVAPHARIDSADISVDECETPSEIAGMVDLAVTWWPNSIAAEFQGGPADGAYYYTTDIADRMFLYPRAYPVAAGTEIEAHINEPAADSVRYRRIGWNTETRRWVYRTVGYDDGRTLTASPSTEQAA